MKTLPFIAAVSLTMIFAASAGESWRTFTSADGKNKIEATLIDFAPETGKVKIKLKASGKETETTIDRFSENDVKWIKETGVWQLRAAKLKVAMKYDKVSEKTIADEQTGELEAAELTGKSKRRKNREKSGLAEEGRTIRVSKEGFKIFISNPGKDAVEGLSCDYVLLTLRKAADNREIVSYEGNFLVDPIEPNGMFTTTTDHVNLDRFERILGMVLYIKHGEDVVRTVESKPGIEKYKEKAAARHP